MFNDSLIKPIISFLENGKKENILSKNFIALRNTKETIYDKDEAISFLNTLTSSTNIKAIKEESYELIYFRNSNTNYISKVKCNNEDSLIESIFIDEDIEDTNTVLIIEYDGSKYFGMQRQLKDDEPTIQKTIEESIFKMIHKKVNIISSSRTDRGVHARGQVISFRSNGIEPLKYKYALNNILPDSIRIKEAYNRSILFNPRFDTIKKTYHYLINTSDKSVFLAPYYCFTKVNNIKRMEEELKSLIGTHDFIAFSRGEKDNTIRTIYEAYLKVNDDIIDLTFTGSGFLHNMIRFIVGALLDIDNNRDTSIKELLELKDKNKTKTIASASGLYLDKIYY